ncbi:MAG TPA: TetR/AcrR family transcriptional regulator [Solirubrobacteraceae bacterium]|nr:TetR/AcrR family transcriptional regulator [Solirubrobacteraceae bacterium]
MTVVRKVSESGGTMLRLRPSPGGLAHERVLAIQRARILAGMTLVVCEQGIESTTVADVVARAGVSRRTFYDFFEDLRDCFLAALDDALVRVQERVFPAYAEEKRWVEGVRAALFELLVVFDEEPQLAALCVVQSLAGGPRVLARRGEIMRALAAVLDQGAGRRAGQVPPLTGEGLAGAVFAVIHARLIDPGSEPLTELSGALMAMIVLPYLGSAAARRELTRRPPVASRPECPASPADPLMGLGMRVTYRTLRVLATIAGHPGVCNRELGSLAGIADQGQTSKLLTRLERLELIHNTGEGHTKGATNAWALTPKGLSIHETFNTYIT